MTSLPSPRGPQWSRRVGHFLARGVWNTHVTGAQLVPHFGPLIFAANHTGLLDGPIVLGVAPRPLHILVKEEMFHGPIGWVLQAAGQIPVDRVTGRAALATARALLNRGDAIGVFPEGNRGRGDGVQARGGVAWLAVQTGAPIIPVAVLGTRFTGQSVNHIPRLRHRLMVEFGAPLDVTPPPGTPKRLAVDQATATIQTALAAHVAQVVARTGIPLPTDDPNHER